MSGGQRRRARERQRASRGNKAASGRAISEKKQLHVSLSLVFLPRRSPRRRVERLLSSTESNSDRLKLGCRWREREILPSESERSKKETKKSEDFSLLSHLQLNSTRPEPFLLSCPKGRAGKRRTPKGKSRTLRAAFYGELGALPQDPGEFSFFFFLVSLSLCRLSLAEMVVVSFKSGIRDIPNAATFWIGESRRTSLGASNV